MEVHTPQGVSSGFPHISYKVLSALVDASSSHIAAANVIRTLAEGQRWDLGILWLCDGGCLRAFGFWHSPLVASLSFDAVAWMHIIPFRQCIPGRVLSTGKPLWIGDIRADLSFIRAQAAAHAYVSGQAILP